MDKCTIKINELNDKIEKLIKQLEKIEKKQNEKKSQKNIIDDKIEKLNNERSLLEEEKITFENIMKNRKYIKIKMILSFILASISILFLFLYPIIGSLLAFSMNFLDFLYICLSALGFLISVPLVSDNLSENFNNEEYLKTHNIKEIENKIFEKTKNILFSIQNQKSIEKELESLEITKIDLSNKIESLKKELKLIEQIRKDVITETLNNNKEFNNLESDKSHKSEKEIKIKKK